MLCNSIVKLNKNIIFLCIFINFMFFSGILSIILQLALIDTFTVYIAVTEIWNTNCQNWTFSHSTCSFFLGTEVLTNTLTSYLLICLNFHIISLWNLHAFENKKSSKNPLTSYNDNDSDVCLVSKSEAASVNRSVTIDYRRRKSDIAVLLPTILAWFVSVSLSVPKYSLSSTLKVTDGQFLCTIVDVYFEQLLQNLLLAFRVIIPLPLFALSVLTLSIKLIQMKLSKESNIDDVLNKKSYKIEYLLIFGISLSIVYIATTVQRDVLYLLHIVSQKYDGENMNTFMTPPFYNLFLSGYINTYLSLLHYSGCVIRPALYVFVLPKFKFLVKSKIFLYKKNGT